MKLILCAGARLKDGWIHHDIQKSEGIDIVCDLKEIEKFILPESCQEIEITHALEHFPRKEVVDILGTIYKLLKAGGILYVEVPNFRWHAELVVHNNEEEKAEYYAFGGQENEWDFHKTGFTENILRARLETAGFKNIKISPESSLLAWAEK